MEGGLDRQWVPASSALAGRVRLATCRPRWCPGWLGWVCCGVALGLSPQGPRSGARLPRGWGGVGSPGCALPEGLPLVSQGYWPTEGGKGLVTYCET